MLPTCDSLSSHFVSSAGKLYQTSDGTLMGVRTEITKPYNIFDAGEVRDQYASRYLLLTTHYSLLTTH